MIRIRNGPPRTLADFRDSCSRENVIELMEDNEVKFRSKEKKKLCIREL